MEAAQAATATAGRPRSHRRRGRGRGDRRVWDREGQDESEAWGLIGRTSLGVECDPGAT
jgi:hypothetical protein